MELGILSLSGLQAGPATGRPHDVGRRTREIVSYVGQRSGMRGPAGGRDHSS
jgi:hypothetical protein